MRPCKIALLLCVVAGILFSSADSWGADNKPPTFRMGYAMRTLYDVDMKDAHAAFQMWSSEIGMQTGYAVTMTMYDNVEALLKDFRNGALDFGIVTHADFFHMDRGEIDHNHIVTNVRGGKKGHSYFLMVQKDSPFQHVKDLKGRKITVLKSDHMGKIFLDTLLLRNKLSESNKFFNLIEEKPKVSQTVLSVFFGQSDACLIPDVTYNTMVELNPQIKQRLRSIATSDNVLVGIGFFRKSYGEEYKNEVFKRIVTLQNSPRGRQILLLFKSEAFAQVEEKEFRSLNKLEDEYARSYESKREQTCCQNKISIAAHL